MLKLITMFCAFFFISPFQCTGLKPGVGKAAIILSNLWLRAFVSSCHWADQSWKHHLCVWKCHSITGSPSGAMAERVYRDVLGRRGQPSEGCGNRLLNTRTRRVRDGVQKMIQDSWENLDSAKRGFSCLWLQGWLSLIGRPSRPIILAMADTLVFMETTHAHRIQHMFRFFAGFWTSSQ